MIADPQTFDRMKDLARRDDWHIHFVGSDIRQMLGEIERLRALLRRADGYIIWEHHPHVPPGFQEEIEAALGIGPEQPSAGGEE